ncbi:putative low-density lipoprotein receptor [Penaeus vannamei]|uniref:Putative low-density lipoprotein receptor n=1 Tax=Penaeus vannamei TaxID=6689 RepID=A0A3R7MGB4_PENVA|nr:putative low-density lipoprotein receptor [Penaeus vannamei]
MSIFVSACCPGLRDEQHCDGRWHCAKGEDELGCFGCDADEWWCGEGTDCYKASRRCNGIADCRNKADEIYCSCLFNQTQCSPNSEFCYDPKTQRCDGILHCPGGEDEIGCGQCMQNISCGGGGGCYTPAQRCDGASQCGDGSDEASCTPQLCHPQHGAFLCANRRCIREAWRCDQFNDCGDASDEEDCHRNSVIVAAAMGGSGQLPAPSQLSGTGGRRNSRSSDEKESEEEGKVNAGLSVPVERQVTLSDRNEEDVPLLSAIGDTDDEDMTEREDVRLLDASAESEESDGEGTESEESDNCSTDTSVVEAEVMSEEESDSEAETGPAESAEQEDALWYNSSPV